MSPRSTALTSPRLSATQRARLAAAGRRYAQATDQAKRTFERNTSSHVAQRDRSIAAAEEEYDAEVAAIMAELGDVEVVRSPR